MEIPARALDEIERHALKAFPRECCGILTGRTVAGGGRRVKAVTPAENVHPSPLGHYAIRPESLLTAHQEARRRGLEVVGYYHSHPCGAARPSGVDLRDAWPDTRYLILSVDGGAVLERRCWLLDEAAGCFVEEPLVAAGPLDLPDSRRRPPVVRASLLEGRAP